MMNSLDQKLTKRCTPKGQGMCLEVLEGRALTRNLGTIPEWTKELCDNDNICLVNLYVSC